MQRPAPVPAAEDFLKPCRRARLSVYVYVIRSRLGLHGFNPITIVTEIVQ
jgi:hypothetical protein